MAWSINPEATTMPEDPLPDTPDFPPTGVTAARVEQVRANILDKLENLVIGFDTDLDEAEHNTAVAEQIAALTSAFVELR